MPPLTRASPVFQKCRHFQLTRPHRQRYAQVQQGFSRRLQLYVQPKLGRCLEWRLAPYSRRGDSITQQVDPYTLSRNYRTSDYDVRHNISANFYYTLTLRLRIALNTLIGGGNTGGTIFYRTVSPSACITRASLTVCSATRHSLTGVLADHLEGPSSIQGFHFDFQKSNLTPARVQPSAILSFSSKNMC
jgi:hypothetical protein